MASRDRNLFDLRSIYSNYAKARRAVVNNSFASPLLAKSSEIDSQNAQWRPLIVKGKRMGTVIHLPKRSSQSAAASHGPAQLDELVNGLGGIADGIAAVENESRALHRCIDAVQASFGAFEGPRGMAAGDQEQLLREAKLTNSKLQSELMKLVRFLRTTQLAAERACQIDRSVR